MIVLNIWGFFGRNRQNSYAALIVLQVDELQKWRPESDQSSKHKIYVYIYTMLA